MRSLSGHLTSGPTSGDVTSGHHHHHHGHHLHGRNGYLSDGEGYILQNQRVSKSGKYGSQASSPRSDRHHHHDDVMMNDEDDESDEDDDEVEDDEDLEDDEDNIEAEIHLNDMKAGQVPPGMENPNNNVVMKTGTMGGSTGSANSSAGGVVTGNGPDMIVSYSAFQAEALAAAGARGSGESLLSVG